MMTLSVLSSIFDFRKKYPITPKVIIGETRSGISIEKDLSIIIAPRNRIEYIAQFLRYLYFLILSILLTVSRLTRKAPSPFPRRINGTERVNAKAPKTPSMENVASITSR